MKRIISITLAFLMLTSSAFAQNYETEYFDASSSDNLSFFSNEVPTLENGSIAIEAEDLEYSSDAKIVSDSNASGEYALTCANKTYANAPEEVGNVTVSLKINVPISQIGRYYLWCRLKTPKAGVSYFEAMNGSNYQTRWFKERSDYYWVKLATPSAGDGIFEYNIKYRDYAFRLDKFVFTNDGSFSPTGKDDLPDELLGIEKDPIAPLPPVTPPAGVHPRVLFREKDIAQIKENAKHPILSTIYAQIKKRAFEKIDCHMPDKGGENNVSIELAYSIQCRALMYALGEADENHARETVGHMKDMYDTLVWTSGTDITRSMGTVLAVSGCVYDWCFDVLTEEDKEYFIVEMKKLASKMEIGYPAGMGETFAGHGGEGELFYFQSTAGIAIYDEDPQMYNAAAGVLYEYMFETRRAFNSAGIHPAGSAYGPVRAMWEVVGQLVFERMGDHSVMGDNFDKIPLTSIHMRQPNGMYVEDGDTWIGISSETGPTYLANDLPLMLYSSYYDNPYVYGEAVKQLSLRNYSGGSSIYDNGVLTLLFLNPNKEFAYPDDYGKEEPLTHFTSYPITTMNARTSWRQGMLGETAQVFVNGQEKLVGDHDHDHSDIGGFSIYYKGLLTSGGGTYSGPEGGWGIPHYYNYYRRTVSKNCVTVYDPNETFKISGYPLNYTLANDGGQRFEENSDTYDEFVSHKDHAKTDSVYAGPNKETPEFSYLKTDLTDAYTEKIAGYTRSTVALNLFNTDYPLVFICYDNISSSDASFKKTWNLQSIDIEPVTDGNITTIERDSYGYTGKLVVNTMLPDLSNAMFTNVGGQGNESLSGGVNYPNWETGNEQGLWRMELSPQNASKDDVFLNAMFVTDKTKNLPNLPMTKYETDKFYGVGVMDRLVFFSKKREMTTESFTLNVPQSEYDETCVLITDVAKGKWQVTGSGVNTVAEVSEEENAIYLRLENGNYTFTKVHDTTNAVKIDYPRDERTLRAGDVLVYNTKEKRFSYTKDPTAMRDNQPFFSEDDFRAAGAKVEVSQDKVTLSKGDYYVILTIGSKEALKNGVSVTNKTAPFVGSGGKVYINALENNRLLGMNVSYDSFSRILKVSSAEPSDRVITLSPVDGTEKGEDYSSHYSPYTLPQTSLTVRATVNLEAGERIAYFLNGKEVGSAANSKDFNFKTVAGENRMQAKLMMGDAVIASSDVIEKTFTTIIPQKNLYSHDLTEWGTNKFVYNQQATETFVPDPAVSEPCESTRKVLKIHKSAGSSINSVLLQIDVGGRAGDYFTFEETGSGIIKIDYQIYAESTVDKIDFGNLWFAGGGETLKHNYLLYADEPGGKMNGSSKTRSSVLPTGRWVDVGIVVDNSTKTYDITIDGVQVTTGMSFRYGTDEMYLSTYTLPSPLSTKGDLVYYLKDVSIYRCAPSGISISPVCKDVKVTEGSMVVIDTISTYENANILYYCNGIEYTDNKVKASAGTNTVYAKVTDEWGNVLETSEDVTFEAYMDTFKETFFREDISLISNQDKYIRTSNLFPGVPYLPRLYYQSVDVSLTDGQNCNIIAGSHVMKKNEKTEYGSSEVWPVLFNFTSDTIEVTTSVTGAMNRNEYIEIPRTPGDKTYNIKIIYDPIYGSYILLVDNVVYSVIDVSTTRGNAKHDLIPRQTNHNIYGFIYLQSSDLTPFSNYRAGYSMAPVGHTTVEYINNSKFVTKREEITAGDDLEIKFTATKGDYANVLCIATVLENSGELVAIKTQKVIFDDTKESEDVTLTLRNLPSDIASEKYTVNVMLWDEDTFAPIVPKTSMP